MKKILVTTLFPILLLLLTATTGLSQMITGYWSGTINRQKVSVKLIQNGDSLSGTSYYYTSPQQYRRYSIKGYFDANTNEAVWWDDALLEEKTGKGILQPGKKALIARADFNCPGGGVMMLDGKAADKESENPRGNIDLDKTNNSPFPDEWDYIIDNYMVGANDPDLIHNTELVAVNKQNNPPVEAKPEFLEIKPEPGVQKPPATDMVKIPAPPETKQLPAATPPPVVKPVPVTIDPSTEEKFATRKKVFVKEIPVRGDTIELRFYDNAQVDGDSISLFLNDKLIFQHIRLTDRAYSVKIAVSELMDSNELIMVAENLGSIPPNTSTMIAIVDGKRHEARLESTEGSSAMIRFVKEPPPDNALSGQ